MYVYSLRPYICNMWVCFTRRCIGVCVCVPAFHIVRVYVSVRVFICVRVCFLCACVCQYLYLLRKTVYLECVQKHIYPKNTHVSKNFPTYTKHVQCTDMHCTPLAVCAPSSPTPKHRQAPMSSSSAADAHPRVRHSHAKHAHLLSLLFPVRYPSRSY